MRKCSRCGEWKSEKDFYKKVGGHDGLDSICKACNKVKGAVYFVRNKGRILENFRVYRATHAEQLQAYYDARKEKYMFYSRVYRKAKKAKWHIYLMKLRSAWKRKYHIPDCKSCCSDSCLYSIINGGVCGKEHEDCKGVFNRVKVIEDRLYFKDGSRPLRIFENECIQYRVWISCDVCNYTLIKNVLKKDRIMV